MAVGNEFSNLPFIQLQNQARDCRLPFPTENVCMELGFSSRIVAAHAMHVAKFIDALWHAIAGKESHFHMCVHRIIQRQEIYGSQAISFSAPDSCCCMYPKSSVHDKLHSVSFIASGGLVFDSPLATTCALYLVVSCQHHFSRH